MRPAHLDEDYLLGSGFQDGVDDSDVDDVQLERDREKAGEAAKAHYVAVGPGRIRQELGVEMDDAKYSGRRVARREVIEENDEDELDDDEDAEEDDEDGESFAGNGVDIGDSDEDDFGEDGEGDEEDAEDEDAAEESRTQLEAEMKQITAEEQKMVESISINAKTDIEKGVHVRAQMSMWDAIVSARITLQPALGAVTRFPTAERFRNFTQPSEAVSKEEAAELGEAVSAAATEVQGLLDDLVTLRSTMIDGNVTVTLAKGEAAADVVKPLKRKAPVTFDDDLSASVEHAWKYATALDDSFKRFRDQTIERWNSKLILAASGASVDRKKFKAINTSVLSQVKLILSDRERLLKRTRLRRDLGSKPSATFGQLPSENAVKDGVTDAHLSAYDSQIFDDGDFYSQLLKELVESRMRDVDDPLMLGMKWVELKQLQEKQKKKKNVDPRASKGRRLRYQPHEKLLSFMAPEPRMRWDEELAGELFNNLFGNKNT
ncbi:hypothetical protein HK101_006306 [Irineochytrium annulatum]|nr:hypothetical protein HK101_006306 [Irineochytrium annulatum]